METASDLDKVGRNEKAGSFPDNALFLLDFLRLDVQLSSDLTTSDLVDSPTRL